MAPKGRGGSSSSDSSSIPSCPGAFSSTIDQVFFAQDVVFLVVFLGISVALCSFRKKSGPGKKLVGIPFILAVFLFVLFFICSIIATVLQQCSVTDFYSYYDWNIALNVFFLLSYWLLLFVIVYQLNAMLREQLGHFTAVFKIIYLAIVGVMAALTVGYMSLTCYNTWTQTVAGENSGATLLIEAVTRYRVAFYVLYMLSVLAAGVLASITIVSLRSRNFFAGNLIGWVVALFAVTLIWSMLNVVVAAQYLQEYYFSNITYTVLSWLVRFFHALSFIFVLCIAKHQAWGNSAVTDNHMLPDHHAPTTQQQYAYNAQPNSQTYYYQQAPGHNAPELVK